MKPFKFRVWNFDLKKFEEYDKFYISMDGHEVIYQDPHANYVDYINPNFKYEIFRSTGLLDGDREVYQGDVYEYDPNSGLPKICSIEFINGRFVFYFINGGFFDYETEFKQNESFDCYRYIGTKFENPELLENLK